MKYKFYVIFSILILFSCKNEIKKDSVIENETIPKTIKKNQHLIGERIDGPANVRDKPNGKTLFELKDNTLVECTPLNENWHQILVYTDINPKEYGIDSLKKSRSIITNNQIIGVIKNTLVVDTGYDGKNYYAILWGYTHKNNIKPESVIENAVEKKLLEKNYNLHNWDKFIRNFDMERDAFNYEGIESFYNYENLIEDPSPGFRIVLLFEKKKLIGLLHSRTIAIPNSETHILDWPYFITFFKSYSRDKQLRLINFINKWFQGVD